MSSPNHDGGYDRKSEKSYDYRKTNAFIHDGSLFAENSGSHLDNGFCYIGFSNLIGFDRTMRTFEITLYSLYYSNHSVRLLVVTIYHEMLFHISHKFLKNFNC